MQFDGRRLRHRCRRAKAAQLDVACYRDGYNHGIDVVTLKPTLVFDRMDEILPTSA